MVVVEGRILLFRDIGDFVEAMRVSFFLGYLVLEGLEVRYVEVDMVGFGVNLRGKLIVGVVGLGGWYFYCY